MDKKIYTIGGTVQSNNGLYIRRKADDELFKLCKEGQFSYILTSRQMGKSSLIAQVTTDLKNEAIETVTIDLNLLGKDDQTAEKWYLGITIHIAHKFNMDVMNIFKWWEGISSLSFSQRFVLFFEKILLSKFPHTQIVIFIDEIDSILGLEFSDDFLAIIRYMYNVRSSNPDFHRISFVLIGSAAPSDLINDPTRTPFNIGYQVDLTDFTFDEITPLARGFKVKTQHANQILKYVYEWTNGHPYLTQNLCFHIAELSTPSDWQKRDYISIVDEIMRKQFLSEKEQVDGNIAYVRDHLLKPDTTDALESRRRGLRKTT